MLLEHMEGELRALILQQSEADRSADYGDENLALVNKYAKKELKREDIYIRSMWICNDMIDSYFSRFNHEALSTISEKFPGAPVLVGHQKATLPIGRFFKAALVAREDGHEWVRSWFYYPKGMNLGDGMTSEDIEKGIDAGLYMECSISWAFKKAICSICAKDIRECPHIPGKEYAIDGDPSKMKLCWYETAEITDVLEGSFVFKGGQHGTSIDGERAKHIQEKNKITRKFTASKEDIVNKMEGEDRAKYKYTVTCAKCGRVVQTNIIPTNLKCPTCGGRLTWKENKQRSPEDPPELFQFVKPLKAAKSASITNEYFDLSAFPKELQERGEFFVEPKYDGIRVQVHKSGDRVVIFTSGGIEIQGRLPLIVEEIRKNKIDNCILDGELIRKRGHSRLMHRDVVQYLNSSDNRDYTLYVKVFDIIQLGENSMMDAPLLERRHTLETAFEGTPHASIVRYVRVEGPQVINAMKMNASKEGCMVKDLAGTYREPSKVWKWKRYTEIDVIVINKREVSGGFVYECGFGDRESPIKLGTTFVTKVDASAGDILRVRLAFIDNGKDGYNWYEPTVVDKRTDKTDPDPLSVVEQLLARRKGDEKVPDTEPMTAEEEAAMAKMIDEDSDEDEAEEGRAKWTSKTKRGLPDAAFCPSLIKTVDGKKIRKCPHHTTSVKAATEQSSLDIPHLRAAQRLLPKVQGFSGAAKAAAKAHLDSHASRLKEKGGRAARDYDEREKWTAAYANDLPNSAFAVIEQDYLSGKTKDKRARHLPHHAVAVKLSTENSSLDLAHYRNTLARVNQIQPVTGESKESLIDRARKHLEGHRSALRGERFYILFKGWEGKNVFHRIYFDDGKWLTLPASLSDCMLCRGMDELENFKSRHLESAKCQIIENKENSTTILFEGSILQGEYRFRMVKIKNEARLIADKIR